MNWKFFINKIYLLSVLFLFWGIITSISVNVSLAKNDFFHRNINTIIKENLNYFQKITNPKIATIHELEMVACESTVSDDFSIDNYSSGTGNWASNWIEVNNGGSATEPDGSDAGQIQIISGQLRIAGISGTDPYIYRIVDLENATAATLTFDLGSSGDLEESGNIDLFEVMISDDGGATWNVLETFQGDSDNGAKSYDILTYVSSNTAVRFWTPSWTNDAGEYFSVDNVSITATCPNTGGGAGGNLTCSAGSNSITGTVFEDFNYDGDYDTGEHFGVDSIIVIATDSLDNTFEDTTDISGNYSFTGLTANSTYRIEFTNIPTWASPTFYGGDNGTTVQFVKSGNCANLGIANPSDYCQTNPTVFVPCYETGSGYGSNSTSTALISFKYQESGSSISKTDETTIDETGATWGVAYDALNERLFTSTILKRAVGMGDGANADATGFIYFQDRSVAVPTLNKFDLNGVNPANSANAVSGGNINLGTINRNRVAGAISGDFDISDTPGEPVRDIDALSKAGVTAFGDIDITEDGSSLWAINLNQRSLIKIDLSASTATLNGASAATLGGLTNQYLIDQIAGIPSCGNGDGTINYDQTDGSAGSTHSGNNDAGTTGVLRPWALKFHKGRGYLGVVCDASISQDPDDLLAYVLSFDPNNIEAGFTEELIVHLDFYRRQNIANSTLDFTYNWQPWIDNFPFTLNAEFDQLGYAQPILSDIEFVAGDDMVLGFIDRFILQNTWGMYRPLTGNTVVFRPESQGTLGYACNNNGVYEFEGTGSCVQNNGTYPGQAQNAQEYFETTRGDTRPYGGMGGLAVSKINGEILAPYIDPFPPGATPGSDYFLTQGIHWFDNSGTRTDWARITGSSAILASKGIALGDAELMCDPAPIEIGNYVWEDIDGDGEQNAGESGIEGIRMELYNDAGNLLAFDTTNSLGHYFFSGNGIDDAIWATADDTLVANTTYYIVAGGNGQYTSGSMTLNGVDYTLVADSTTTGTNRYEIDSDGKIATNIDPDLDGEPYVQITTGNPGEVDHSFDFGFKPECKLNITTTYSNNCTEPTTNNFTADWNIGFEVSSAPDNAISYQRNSETVQTHTLTGTTDTLTISGIIADGGASDTLKVWFTNEPTCADTIILKRPLPCPTNLGSNPGEICSSIANTEIKGTVFEDWNYDGTMNQSDTIGVQGIQVLAYDCDNNLVATTYTDSDGNYQFMGLTTGENYRIEFNLPESVAYWANPTQAGTDNGTTVQFVQPGNCSSLGIASPQDYCQTNPNYFTTCYVPLDPINGSFANEPMGAAAPFNTNSNSKSELTFKPESNQTGATYGVAWQATSQSLFVSSYMKQTTGFGPDGGGSTTTGGIYKIVDDGAGNPVVTLFTDLQSLGTGDDPHPTTTDICNSMEFGNNNNACWYHDINAFGKTGKLSLGDLELTPDGQHLITVNLNERTLIRIPLGNNPENPIAGTPEEFELSQLFNTCSDESDWRPFALGKNNGMMYLGAVCSAESTQSTTDLKGLIYEFDPNNPTSFQLIFSFDLDYEREGIIRSCTPACKAYWQPWTNVESEMTFHLRTSGSGQPKADGIEPMPMVTDIEFFGNDLIIGLRDRASDMLGDDAGSPFDYNSERLFSEVSAGDMLRAARNPDGTYTLENNGITGSYTSAEVYNGGSSPGNLNSGPGGKEFYSDGFGVHSELPLGGLAQIPGNSTVILTSMNPFSPTVSSGGVAGYNNFTGTRVTGNVYFDRDDNFDFGKNGGLGDIELMCDPAPIEIGNYVWEDTDGDGIQDACENGIASVTVELVKSSTVIATTQTDANGQYYFSDKNATDANLTWSGTGADTALIANTAYTIRISNAEGDSQQAPLNTFFLTTTDANSNNSDNIDNDALLNGNHAEITATTGDHGYIDHSFDFGFVPFLCSEITELVATRTICSGGNVDTLAALTTFSNPDSIAFVYFTNPQTDSSVIYTSGIGIDTVQIAIGNDTARITDISGFTTTGITPDTFYVYAIAHPTPTINTCRPYEEILIIVQPCDWGDLPDISALTNTNDYQTTRANDGPVHAIIAGLSLGSTVDSENDGNPSNDALGDGLDEDGLSVLGSLDIQPAGNFRLPLSYINTTSDTAYIEAWIDWNGDGDFEDANEMIFDAKDPNQGLFDRINVMVPSNAVNGQQVGLRIRISNTDNMTPYGYIATGEIEDYLVGINCPSVICVPISTITRQ